MRFVNNLSKCLSSTREKTTARKCAPQLEEIYSTHYNEQTIRPLLKTRLGMRLASESYNDFRSRRMAVRRVVVRECWNNEPESVRQEMTNEW